MIKWMYSSKQRSWLGGGIASVALLAGAAWLAGELGIGHWTESGHGAAFSGGAPVMRRLTPLQYQHIIADVFGPDIKIGGRFDPVTREAGLLEVGAGQMSIGTTDLDQYANMARTIAAQVVDRKHRAALVGCVPASETNPDDQCAAQFLSQVARLLFRRPLAQEDLSAEVEAAAGATKTQGNFYAGLESALSGMLKSPQFLFDREVAIPDSGHPGQWTLDSYSRASRLSFLLWDTAPDGELLKAAGKGDLDSDRGVARQVDRMLASPRLEAGVRAFFTDMLGFDGFDSLAKDPTIYPNYSFTVAADAQEQTLRTITDLLLTRRGDYRDLFTTRTTFLSRALGAVYGIPVPKGAPGNTPDGWMPFEYPEGDPRTGILMQTSFLALHSHPGRSSPTLRGRALREIILCQKVPDPPGNVNFNLVQDTANPMYKTARQRLTAHRTNPTCAGCHKIMDPVGLSMEHFDSTGGYRATENGASIDPSGELDGSRFSDSIGLGKTVHDHPATSACVVDRLYSYAIGRALLPSEAGWLRSDLLTDFERDGYRFPQLLRRITTSGVFFQVTPPGSGRESTRSASVESVQTEVGK